MERRETNYRIIAIIVLLASILFMSIGYAIRSTDLRINGSTTIDNAKWDVHFENVDRIIEGVDDKYVYTPAKIVDIDGTYIVYDVKLPNKGDFYEFQFDVVNEGTMDAKVSSLITHGSDDYKDYLHYGLTYVDDGRGVYANDILKSGESRRVALRVTNVYEGQEMIDKVFNLSFTIHYIQK